MYINCIIFLTHLCIAIILLLLTLLHVKRSDYSISHVMIITSDCYS